MVESDLPPQPKSLISISPKWSLETACRCFCFVYTLNKRESLPVAFCVAFSEWQAAEPVLKKDASAEGGRRTAGNHKTQPPGDPCSVLYLKVRAAMLHSPLSFSAWQVTVNRAFMRDYGFSTAKNVFLMDR